MTVNKIIRTTEPTELEITGATLLSAKEYVKYMDNVPLFKDWWWLRLPGGSQNYAAGVYNGGSVDYYGLPISYISGAVRPALRIKNLESSNLQIGDKFNINDHTFTIISDEYALCDSSIGEHRFDRKSNNYEESEIKRFVDKWFEEIFND